MAINQECYGCQYRSRIDPKFCNNYMLPIKEASIECKADGDRESILIQTRGRSWLAVDEITELKRTAVEA